MVGGFVQTLLNRHNRQVFIIFITILSTKKQCAEPTKMLATAHCKNTF